MKKIYFKDLPQGSKFVYAGEKINEFTVKKKVFVCPSVGSGTFQALIIKHSLVTRALVDVPVVKVEDD